jgi:polar amino acid transport system substrate-binding protein
MRIHRSISLTAAVLGASAVALTGLGSAVYGSGRAPGPLAAAPALAPRAATVANTTCADGQNQVASLTPGNITTDPRTVTDSPTMTNIRKNGHLTVGTSGDVLLWGATDPGTGDLEGYDIDLLAQIAKYAGVSPGRTVYKVINYGQRLTSLQDKSVDIVAHTMTINCDRWQGTGSAPNAINFSSEYYRAGQRVLVRSDSKVTSIQGLKNQAVCVPAASTNLTTIQKLGLKKIVALDVIGDCLVKFQEGEVQAITGDDTVLAGFAAQDPYAKVVGSKFSEEPYGMGINADDKQFTQFVNAVLQKLRSDGTLQGLYDKWMKQAVGGPEPAVPQPVYGRVLTGLKRK